LQGRFRKLGAYLELDGFDGVLQWILQLRQQLGIPHTLADLNLDEAAVLALAGEAARDPSAGSNPIPVDEAAHRELFRNCLHGRLSPAAA